jgi:photosystem II stability/assembly factor-like uncharacterized protein
VRTVETEWTADVLWQNAPVKTSTVALALTVAAVLPPPGGSSGTGSSGPPQWTPQTSGVTSRLRGVSAVSDRVVWASGAHGTVLRSADRGATWQTLAVPDAEKLDFRDVDAVDETTAYILSIGSGPASRIYKTTDAGARWTLQFTNEDPKAFFDAMAFWDARSGLAVSDSVDGRFVVIATRDGGAHWTRIPASALPPALPNEGAFAGSGTNVAVAPGGRAWIGTGASTRSRVLRTTDGGKTWAVADTPLATSASAGIFSVAFRDPRHGLAVGGDYRKEQDATNVAAASADGGVTWTPVAGLTGFRSIVAHLPGSTASWIAVGPSGADVTTDDGKTWTRVEGAGYHAFSFAPGTQVGWGVGENGRIARLVW